ncbi:reverse transcriptase family protein [Comamonas sp. AG1104]|uniref:reverse transcriptase family protein n=1 Tax=Comamonas sp. AG1104 TaxID=2183900 RepID=UPI000E2B3B01|nr:reverse transcriptase family protein [Comamonas sp. AG1104]RDI14792.1 reverse transcriptase (RNA-dependent DNA polymerase) [Comamonas sp. AG1104]
MSKPPRKRYPINQSPLFRIRGKGQFKSITGIDWDTAPSLLHPALYRVWVNEKGREIQQPLGQLADVHRRIGNFLARIELPDYLYSQRGRSYADNARQHVGEIPLVKTDIHKFYPSTTWSMVFKMFVEDFECAEDVAQRLTDLCCYRQKHLPTGSAVSGRVAFFAARQLFDSISKLAVAQGCTMTAYVDDITISGDSASKSLLGEVRKLVHQHGLKTKQKKSKTYAATAAKPVTGAVISGNELRLPNERHKKIHEVRKELAAASDTEKPRLQRVLRGRMQEAKQILSP